MITTEQKLLLIRPILDNPTKFREHEVHEMIDRITGEPLEEREDLARGVHLSETRLAQTKFDALNNRDYQKQAMYDAIKNATKRKNYHYKHSWANR